MAESMEPTAAVDSRNIVRFSIQDLALGEARRVVVHNVPFMVLKPSRTMLESLEQLDKHVWYRQRPKPLSGPDNIYVYSPIGERCPVVKMPPRDQDPFDLKRKWLGGYVDPCRDVSYDYAGRVIRTHEYTNNGYSRGLPSLYVPRYYIAGEVLEIDMSHGRTNQ